MRSLGLRWAYILPQIALARGAGARTRGCGTGWGRFVGYRHVRDALPLGNVFEGFSRPDNRRQLLDTSPWRRIECIHCGYRDRCNGGCPAVNVRETGSVYSPPFAECQGTRLYAELQKVSSEYIRIHLPQGGALRRQREE